MRTSGPKYIFNITENRNKDRYTRVITMKYYRALKYFANTSINTGPSGDS